MIDERVASLRLITVGPSGATAPSASTKLA